MTFNLQRHFYLCTYIENISFVVSNLLYYTRGPFEVVRAVLFYHIPKLYSSITATCRGTRRKTQLDLKDQAETCNSKDTTNPEAADLWPGGWRWSQRSYWPRELCEWPSRCVYTEPASSSTALVALLYLPSPATGEEHGTEKCAPRSSAGRLQCNFSKYGGGSGGMCFTSSSQLSAKDVMSS